MSSSKNCNSNNDGCHQGNASEKQGEINTPILSMIDFSSYRIALENFIILIIHSERRHSQAIRYII